MVKGEVICNQGRKCSLLLCWRTFYIAEKQDSLESVVIMLLLTSVSSTTKQKYVLRNTFMSSSWYLLHIKVLVTEFIQL
jgi:hypothetical protein